MPNISIVDLSECGIHVPGDKVTQETYSSIGKNLCETFAETGFAYAKNSGISIEEIETVYNICDKFYDQPNDVKSLFGRNFQNFGYVGMEVESLNPKRPGDLKECFNVNGWGLNNKEAKWPDEVVKNFRKTLTNFYDKCYDLSHRILKLLAAGLHLKDEQFLASQHLYLNKENNQTTMRLLRYPPIGQKVKPNQIRLGEHSDYGSFTLLFQDNIGGLQVESLKGKYEEVAPVSNTIVLNIGDILQFWTEGRLKSTKHRVLIPEDQKKNIYRRSLVFFVHPDDDALLKPLEYKDSAPWGKKVSINPQEAMMTAKEYAYKLFNKTY